MATTYVQPGKTLTLVAPYDCTPGHGALVGSIFGVSLGTVLSTVSGEFSVAGVWTLAKTSAQAWTVGQKIYWDNSNHRCDSDSTVGQLIGVATAVAANPSSTGNVRLNGSVPSALEGPQAAEADLTDNSGGAAADGTIAAVTTFTPSLAWNGTDVHPSAADATAIAAAITALMAAVKELSTKQNAVLAKLRIAGIIAT
jgi:predicted RecA/RadA family phage recombinase